LERLQQETHRLAEEELDQAGDPTDRYRAARALNEQLTALQGQIEAAGAAALTDLWRAAQRDLIFLLAMADAAAAPPAQDALSLARQLSAEAFELAKAMAAGQPNRTDLQQRAAVLDRQLKELAQTPGGRTLDVQQALGETGLDIRFVLAGGKGPTSLRLHGHLREGKKRNDE
jgi:hypothetical protein